MRASSFPRPNTALALHGEQGGSRNNVITFKTDFQPSGFDRPVTGPFKDEIRARLNAAGVVTVTLVFTRGPHRELLLHLDGPDEEIVRAKAALHIAQIDPPSNGPRD